MWFLFNKDRNLCFHMANLIKMFKHDICTTENLFWCTVLQDVINTLLPKVLTKIIEGLQDLDDDVRAVAAASLVPVVESLVYLQTQKVNLIFLHFLTLELVYIYLQSIRKNINYFFLLHSPFFWWQRALWYLWTQLYIILGKSESCLLIYFPSCAQYVGNVPEKKAHIFLILILVLDIQDFCLFWFWLLVF